ncbi:hypothetical protein ACIGHF_14660 [Stenotrophomonas sp. NPDC077464]|uniref:hypothetical protein n=1 Tax=unclassified Stenotrophomonas TaxID=196198 RepID=UPI0037D073A8
MRKYLIAATLGLLVFNASAKSDCPNYKQVGSYFAGRTFTSWDVVPVSAEVAYKRIKIEGVKSGLTLRSEDKESGLLMFEQNTQGSKGQVTLPWNVAITPQGANASKVEVTKLTPGGYMTGEKFQRESTCAVINAATGES